MNEDMLYYGDEQRWWCVWDDDVGKWYDDVNYIMIWLNEVVLYTKVIV